MLLRKHQTFQNSIKWEEDGGGDEDFVCFLDYANACMHSFYDLDNQYTYIFYVYMPFPINYFGWLSDYKLFNFGD